MGDERARRLLRAAKTSENIALTFGVLAIVLVLVAVGTYSGTAADARLPFWALLLGVAGLLCAPVSAAFAAVSYVVGVLAETERLP